MENKNKVYFIEKNKTNKEPYRLLVNLQTATGVANLDSGNHEIKFLRFKWDKEDFHKIALEQLADFERLVNYLVVNKAQVRVNWSLLDDNLRNITFGEIELMSNDLLNKARKDFKVEYAELTEKEQNLGVKDKRDLALKRAKLENNVNSQYLAYMLKAIEEPMSEIRKELSNLIPAGVEEYK